MYGCMAVNHMAIKSGADLQFRTFKWVSVSVLILSWSAWSSLFVGIQEEVTDQVAAAAPDRLPLEGEFSMGPGMAPPIGFWQPMKQPAEIVGSSENFPDCPSRLHPAADAATTVKAREEAGSIGSIGSIGPTDNNLEWKTPERP